MKLTSYMSVQGLGPEEMAIKIGGVSSSAVVKWMRNERTPRPDQLRRIAEITDGAVMPNDFIMESAA